MTEENNHTAHDKNVFQLERIALFSDAVFAIALTLLIIEIKIPDVHEGVVTDTALLNGLFQTIPKFIGFFVSFFVIALYWISHHRMFYYLHSYNQKLLWANILFLLTIVVMPFSTALYSEYFNPMLHVPLIVYTVNISFSGLYSFRLWRLVGNTRYNLSKGLDGIVIRYNSMRALLAPCLFISIAMLSYINYWVAFIAPPFVPFATMLIRRHYHKKYPDIMNKHAANH